MVSRKKIRGGRINQKLRTRKEILRAAERLLSRGERPTLESVAEEAMVSRATVYRYFSNLDMLLAEAPLDVQTLEADQIFAKMPAARKGNPAARAVRVHDHLHEVVAGNESRFRLFLKSTMEQWISADGHLEEPLRGARRLVMLDAALEPIRKELDRKTYQNLRYALAMLVSVEGFIALTDVCRLDRKNSRRVGAWAVRKLILAVMAGKAGSTATRRPLRF